jgi:hypothetical protein
MMLLVDYLEEATAYLREKRERLQKLDQQFRKIYDRDLKKEMATIKVDIKKKSSEINYQLLLNLEEFRALNKYYRELLQAYMDDENIGKVISKKSWLLDFRSVPPKQAAARLEQLRYWRGKLREAKKFLKKWVGRVDARSITATYPVLKGYMSGEMDREEAIATVDKVDNILLREGWLILISDSLIQIPLAKFLSMVTSLRYQEAQAQADLRRATGRGTVAETAALRKYQEIFRKRQHYESAITQILLANPDYLRSLKKKKSWLSRDRSGYFEKMVETIVPHRIKERVWLNEMNKKLSGP